MKVIGLVQARMGSTRLPGKVMRDLGGQPLIFHIFDRLAAVADVSELVLATTQDARNDELAAYVSDTFGATVVRAEGEDDIAERLALAMEITGADAMLKINGDCPLVDRDVLQLHLDALKASPDADYISNKAEFTWPVGMSTEVISASAIRRAASILVTAQDREFICSHIKNNPEQYPQISVIRDGEDLSIWDLCIDTPPQYQVMQALFEDLYRPGEYFGLPEVLSWLHNAKLRTDLDLGCLEVPEAVRATLGKA